MESLVPTGSIRDSAEKSLTRWRCKEIQGPEGLQLRRRASRGVPESCHLRRLCECTARELVRGRGEPGWAGAHQLVPMCPRPHLSSVPPFLGAAPPVASSSLGTFGRGDSGKEHPSIGWQNNPALSAACFLGLVYTMLAVWLLHKENSTIMLPPDGMQPFFVQLKTHQCSPSRRISRVILSTLVMFISQLSKEQCPLKITFLAYLDIKAINTLLIHLMLYHREEKKKSYFMCTHAQAQVHLHQATGEIFITAAILGSTADHRDVTGILTSFYRPFHIFLSGPISSVGGVTQIVPLPGILQIDNICC